jgi:hypothetical protein
MRKQVIKRSDPATNPGPLNLEKLGRVEVTSEDQSCPIEAALVQGIAPGWRAAEAGEQVIRLRFDEPLRLQRIQLLFIEEHEARTQEFVLRWSCDRGDTYRELFRQQYNFAPQGSTRESEDYDVDLDGVTALELSIVPDISRGPAVASLAALRLWS